MINHNQCTKLPMLSDLVTRVQVLTRRNPSGMPFSNWNLLPFILDDDFVDDNDDSTNVPDALDDATAGVADADNDDDDNDASYNADEPETADELDQAQEAAKKMSMNCIRPKTL
jgi:hypothetical protein